MKHKCELSNNDNNSAPLSTALLINDWNKQRSSFLLSHQRESERERTKFLNTQFKVYFNERKRAEFHAYVLMEKNCYRNTIILIRYLHLFKFNQCVSE